MITKNSLVLLMAQNENSLEYEFTEKWLETTIEPQLIEFAKQGETDYEFIVHVSEANPSMIRKILSDKGFGVLMWADPIDAKPPITRFKIKVLW